MAALATRYSGELHRRPAGRPCPRSRHFEIWNEPNLSGFLIAAEHARARDPTDVRLDTYAAMDRAAYRRSRGPTPRRSVIAGVGGPRSSTSPTGVGADRLAARPGGARRSRSTPTRSTSTRPRRRLEPRPTWCRAGARIGRFLDEHRRVPPRAATSTSPRPATRRPRRRSATRRSPRSEQADYLDPDLLAAAAPQRAGQGGRLVQPPGQRELAGRPAARGLLAQAELRAVRAASSRSRAARSSTDEAVSARPAPMLRRSVSVPASIGSTLQPSTRRSSTGPTPGTALGDHLAPLAGGQRARPPGRRRRPRRRARRRRRRRRRGGWRRGRAPSWPAGRPTGGRAAGRRARRGRRPRAPGRARAGPRRAS